MDNASPVLSDGNFSADENNRPLRIKVIVRDDKDNLPISGISVNLATHPDSKVIDKEKTDKEGISLFTLDGKLLRNKCELDNLFVEVMSPEGNLIFSTSETPFRLSGPIVEINILLDHEKLFLPRKERLKQKIQVGPLKLDAEGVAKAEPQIVFDIARLLVNKKVSKESIKKISDLSEDLLAYKRITLCYTDILLTIEALIKLKKWPRDVALKVDDILGLSETGFD